MNYSLREANARERQRKCKHYILYVLSILLMMMFDILRNTIVMKIQSHEQENTASDQNQHQHGQKYTDTYTFVYFWGVILFYFIFFICFEPFSSYEGDFPA